MKLGIVGSGLIVDTLFQFIHELQQVEIKAICGVPESIDKLNQLSKDHNIDSVYTDYDQFLQSDQFDTVYVAVPNNLHYPFSKKALLANKNVICEKPLTSTYKQACHLAEIAREKNLVLVEAISNQHNPNYHKIKELIPSLGDIKIVSLNYTQYSSRYDAFKQGTILPAFDVNKSGGALMDLNVYNVHFIVGLFGEPTDVQYYPNIERNIDTSGVLVLKYPTFTATLVAAKDCASPLLNTIQGNQGCIYSSSPLFTLTDFSYQLNKQEPLHYDLTDKQHRMKPEFIKFAELIDTKNTQEADKYLTHSLTVSKVCNLARNSANIVFPDDSAEL